MIEGDVGIHPTSAEGLAKLAPADAGGVVTYGTQTHPADGTAGLVVTTAARARELAGGEGIARDPRHGHRPRRPGRDAQGSGSGRDGCARPRRAQLR